ncbi:MAG: HD-GYP domain-containing protein [bacterium]
MEDETPIYKSLTFKFLSSTAVFILIIESFLLVMSIYGMNSRLLHIRSLVIHTIPPVSTKVKKMILPPSQIEDFLWTYARNITLMVGVILTVVLSGLYFVVRDWFLSPIETVLEFNQKSREGEVEMIPEDRIPDDEMGTLMKSRNNMLDAINSLYSEDALETLCEAVDAKDRYTEGHSRRVGMLGELLGRKLELKHDTCEDLHYSGTLHDIGKIGVPDQILNKEGSLTEEEFQEIEQHPVRGGQIIQFSNISDRVIHGIRYHHERYDGDGYPEELSGDDIPLFGRILAVADAIDAMLSKRTYRNALSLDVVIEELEKNSGKQFDPEVAEIGSNLVKECRDQENDFLEEHLPKTLQEARTM